MADQIFGFIDSFLDLSLALPELGPSDEQTKERANEEFLADLLALAKSGEGRAGELGALASGSAASAPPARSGTDNPLAGGASGWTPILGAVQTGEHFFMSAADWARGSQSVVEFGLTFALATSDGAAGAVWEPVDPEPHAPVEDYLDSSTVDFVPTDPLFANQLHLRNTNAGQFDIRVEEVWDDYSGNGIEITVIDSRVDRFHPDYDANYSIATDWDYIDNDTAPDSDLSNNERHGTAVIGIIAAEQGNGIGGVGVAWSSTVRNYGGLSFSDGDEQVLDAAGLGDGVGNIHGNANGADIVSMSFGINVSPASSPNTNQTFNNDMSTTFLPDVQAVEGALANAAANGRGGLGTIYVKSAGNSRDVADDEDREESTADYFDTSKYTIVVAATRWDGWVDNTSTPGANLLVAAPTDNLFSNSAVVTTDLQGTAGYNTSAGTAGDYTTTFGGTSAAAPQVSGVVALMLEANPDLGWRDVQKILAYSARHVGSAVGSNANTGAPAGGGFEQATVSGDSWFWNAAADWNGGGLHFSNDYGFGLVDAKAAVRLAETWRDQSTSANDVSASQDVDGANVTTTYGSVFTTFTTTETTNISIEHVYLNIDVSVLDDMNDMEIYVTSPGGTRVQAIADTGGAQGITAGNTGFTAGGGFDWTFGITAFWGEESAGTWTVEIRDDDVGGQFTTIDVDLFFYGSAISTNDLFIVTNEFSDYAGIAGHSTNFAGGGGTDVLNAAAVDSDTVINLLTNSGTIDGVAIGNSNIQIVYTGDGNDTILGDTFSDELYSGRGDDLIDVNEAIIGNNTYDGGEGIDTIDWSSVAETGATFNMALGTATDASANVDRMVNFENLEGTNNADTIIGTAGINTIDGNGGDDIIDGGNGLDVLFGGAGIDTIDYSGFTFGGFFATTINLETGRWTSFTSTEIIEQFENVEGSQGAESIIGTTGVNVINGNAGNDTIRGNGGADLIDAGSGNDIVVWQAFSNGASMSGGTGIDTIDGDGVNFGSSAVFNLAAGTYNSGTGTLMTWASFENYDNSGSISGDEQIIGSSGANTIIAGGGNNSISGSFGADHLEGGGGNDTLAGGFSTDTVFGGDGDDLFIQGNGENVDHTYGGTGIDTYDASAVINAGNAIQIDMAAGTITGLGGAGLDFLGIEEVIATQLGDTICGDANDNTISGEGGDDSLCGEGGNDLLFGGDDNDILRGGLGNDTNHGDSGNDTLYGDGGVDTNYGGAGDDTIVETDGLLFEHHDGGAGIDTLDYSGTFLAAMKYDLVAGLVSFNTASLNTDTALNFENVLTGHSDSEVIGTTGANLIVSQEGDDSIDGNGGGDSIFAGAGNDYIRLNQSTTIDAGSGDDTVQLILGPIESVDGGTGVDTILSTQSWADGVVWDLDAGTRTFGLFTGTWQNFENSINTAAADRSAVFGTNGDNTITTGGGDNSILGRGGNDIISSGAGDDEIDDGTGADTVDAGAGDDIVYWTSGSADSVDGGTGNDTINGAGINFGSIARFDLSSNAYTVVGGAFSEDWVGFENYDNSTSASGAEQVIGSDGDNRIATGGGNNSISALGGADSVDGGAGDDFIDGGLGDDSLFDGTGSDTIFGGEGNDFIDVDNGIGATNADTADGGAGDDTIRRGLGQVGEDAYFGGTGIDTIDTTFQFFTSAVHFDLSTNQMTSSGSFFETWDGFENFFNNTAGSSERVTGTSDANTITTGGGDNSILGLAGDDLINSGAGNDSIDAGVGNDTVFAGAGDDLIDDNQGTGSPNVDHYDGGAGIDTLDLVLNWSNLVVIDLDAGEQRVGATVYDTYANIENLLLGGALNAIGTSGNNVITAVDTSATLNSNSISGLGGDDTISGAGGDDLLFGGDGNDVIFGGEGNDTIDPGQSSDFDDTVFGGEGDDRVLRGIGQAFEDEYHGGAGNDTIVTNGITAGTAVFNLAAGRLQNNGADFEIWDSFENYDGTAGSGDEGVLGSNGTNVIQMGSGDNSVNAGGGSDTVDGGAGDDQVHDTDGTTSDSYNGGAGVDTLDYSGILFIPDVVFDAVAGTIGNAPATQDTFANFETLIASQGHDILIGGGSLVVLDGHDGDDSITGGAGDETLIGGIGDDDLNGGGGDDLINAELGSDTVGGGAGNDHVQDTDGTTSDSYDGGAGDDTLDYSGILFVPGVVFDAVAGTVGNSPATQDTFADFETLIASRGHDILIGGGSVVVLDGNEGDDDITGSAAAESLLGGLGNDTMTGLAGDDTLDGGAGNDALFGGLDDDVLMISEAGLGSDTYDGGDGSDTIDASALTLVGHFFNLTTQRITAGLDQQDLISIENVTGSQGDDDIRGDGAANTLDGQGGNDFLKSFAGADVLFGGDGLDTLDGGDDGDTLDGGADNDRIIGWRGSDTMIGGSGDDFLRGDQQGDEMHGGTGSDRLLGNGGSDVMFGDEGNDVLDGGGDAAADTLFGGSGIDRLFGRAGADVIDSGTDRDKIQGGTGSDTFIFRVGDGIDDVIDWEDGIDVVDFSDHAGFNSLADVLAVARDAPGGRLFIGDPGDADIIVLRNMSVAQLDAGDFVFS